MINDIIEGTTENPRKFENGESQYVEPNENGEVQASPEEQQDYDLLVTRARKMIFGKSKEKVLQVLGSSETPAKGMGMAGAMIARTLVKSSEEQGRQINADVVTNAGIEIVQDLNDLAVVNNVFKYDSPEDENNEMSDALLWGVKFYNDQAKAAGEITPEMQKEAQTLVQQGIQEEQSGGGRMQKKPIPQGVNQAMNPKPPGLVGGAMSGGM